MAVVGCLAAMKTKIIAMIVPSKILIEQPMMILLLKTMTFNALEGLGHRGRLKSGQGYSLGIVVA